MDTRRGGAFRDTLARLSRISPFGQIAAAPLTDVAHTEMDWDHPDLIWRRSRFGKRTGVYEVTSPDNCLVLKGGGPMMRSEILATQLAQLVSIPTPLLRVERSPGAAVRRHLGGDGPIMVMRFVAGRAFKELREEDRRCIMDGIGRPESLLRVLGRIVAFDYFICNPDRFPVKGLEGNNPGNLMIDEDGLQAIDNTLPFRLLNGGRTFELALGQALDLLRDPDSPIGDACLRNITQFFPAAWDVRWANIKSDIVAGFCEQARLIAKLHRWQLLRLCRQVFGGSGGRDVEAMFFRHLKMFETACKASSGAL